MKNILTLVIPFVVIGIVFIIAAIVVVIKKPKQYKFTAITLVLLAIALFIAEGTRFGKDIINKETYTFVGTYERLETSGITGTNTNYFTVDGEQQKVYIPKFYWSDYNLVEGERYKVTYYAHSGVVQNIEPV